MSLVDFTLPYESRKRTAALSRDAQLAQGAYSRFLSQQRGTRNIADLDRSMTRGLERFGSSYGRRGLATSGLFAQAQNDYAQGWAQQKQDLLDQLTQIARQGDLQDQQTWANYNQTVADIEAEKAAQILATASQLNDYRQYFGG